MTRKEIRDLLHGQGKTSSDAAVCEWLLERLNENERELEQLKREFAALLAGHKTVMNERKREAEAAEDYHSAWLETTRRAESAESKLDSAVESLQTIAVKPGSSRLLARRALKKIGAKAPPHKIADRPACEHGTTLGRYCNDCPHGDSPRKGRVVTPSDVGARQ